MSNEVIIEIPPIGLLETDRIARMATSLEVPLAADFIGGNRVRITILPFQIGISAPEVIESRPDVAIAQQKRVALVQLLQEAGCTIVAQVPEFVQ